MEEVKVKEVNRNGKFVGGYIAPKSLAKVEQVKERLTMLAGDMGFGRVNTTMALEYIIERFDVDEFIPIDPKAVGHASNAKLN